MNFFEDDVLTRIGLDRCASFALMLVALAPDVLAQDRVWKNLGDKASTTFGESMDSLGDIDGDGVPDVIVSAADYENDKGLAVIYSGRDGSTIYAIHGNNNEVLGSAVSRTGDLDGDGIPDFAVSTFNPGDTRTFSGRVTVYSGSTATKIWEVDGNPGDFLGSGIADVGDLDGDGIDDLIVGARFGFYAREMSGKDGSTLLSITSPSLTPGDFPWSVAAGGDLDGDGVGDFMLSDPYNCDPGPCTGAAYVFSGKTGLLLYTEYGLTDKARMGLGMAVLGDVNGDGFNDFAAGAPAQNTASDLGAGYAVICSGKDGSTIFAYDQTGLHHSVWNTGASFGAIGDLNQDGCDEFLIGAPGAGDFYSAGNVYLYSGRDGGGLYHYEDSDSVHLMNAFGHKIVTITPGVAGSAPAFAVTAPGEDDSTGLYVGSISAWKTHKLCVDAEPRIVPPNTPVTLQLGQGAASQFYAFFLVDVAGAPLFNLLSLGTFDATGRGFLSGRTNNTTLGGITIGIQGFTINAANKVVVSNQETILLQ